MAILENLVEFIRIHPKAVAFVGFTPGQTYKKRITATNISCDTVHAGVALDQQDSFKYSPVDIVRIKPFCLATFDIDFFPQEIKHYSTCLELEINRYHKINVPIQGYPMISLRLPPIVSFVNTQPEDESYRYITVSNPSDTDYSCTIRMSDPQKTNFAVAPQNVLLLPRKKSQQLVVTFKPKTMATESETVTFCPFWGSLPGKVLKVTLIGTSNPFSFDKSDSTPKAPACVPGPSTSTANDVTIRKSDPYRHQLMRLINLNPIVSRENAARHLLQRRHDWITSNNIRKSEKLTADRYKNMGVAKQEVPSNQRESILVALGEAIDASSSQLRPCDRKVVMRWLTDNLPSEILTHNDKHLGNNRRTADVSPIMITVSNDSVPEEIVRKVALDFVDRISRKKITVESTSNLFPRLKPMFDLVFPIGRLSLQSSKA